MARFVSQWVRCLLFRYLQPLDSDKAAIYRLNAHIITFQKGHAEQKSALQFQHFDLTLLIVSTGNHCFARFDSRPWKL
jgi:hypothetical protein